MQALPHASTPTEPASYCVACDQTEPCACDAPRYLDPITYRRVKGVGWAVPDTEKHRYNNPVRAPKKSSPTTPTRPVQHLVTDLEQYAFLDDRLEASFRAAYEENPSKVTLLTEHLIRTYKTGASTNPSGLLASRLKALGQ